MSTIEVKQLPVISHKAVEIGKAIKDRIAQLNIDKMVATNDTIKVLKEIRADLKKEYTELETQRKTVKKTVLAPYDEFEALYKDNIANPYTSADTLLKDKIDAFELMVKDKKKASVESYFYELCQSENIDFVKFENVGLNINLSTTEKAYKEQCNEFVQRIKDDLELIKKQEFEIEILAEFKKTLNASKAIIAVTDRKEAERKEKIRIEEQEWSRRKSKMLDISMSLYTDTNTFQFNDEIYINAEIVRNSSKADFEKLIIELDEKIKFELKKGKPVKESELVSTPKAEPLKAPEQKLPQLRAVFECFGTLPELKSIGAYLREKGIKYNNLENV